MYYLDTTFLIDLLQKKSRTFEILKKITDSVLTTGTINVHEYLVGGYGAKDEIRELKARRKVLSKILILPYDEKSAEASSLIESSLRKSGEMIGTADILIAGIMKANGVKSIITTNVKHFNKIEGIEVMTY